MTLPRPRTSAGASALDRIVAEPRSAVLAFDFDGTLAPIVSDPRDARAHPRAVAVLDRLAGAVRAVVVLTGRPARTAVEYGGLDRVGGIIVLGQYGTQRWEAGELSTPEPPPGVESARRELPGVLERAGAPEGVWVEDKQHALAVHTRRTAEPDAALDLLREPLADLAERAGLAVEPGRMVIELRPEGMDKGKALLGLAVELDPGALLYAGDDLGDLAAFDAVRELSDRGTPGLTVCSGSDEVAALAERADLLVEGPDGVVRLLDELASALGA